MNCNCSSVPNEKHAPHQSGFLMLPVVLIGMIAAVACFILGIIRLDAASYLYGGILLAVGVIGMIAFSVFFNGEFLEYKIKFDGDRTAAINKAAENLAIICSSGSFCVSFVSNDPQFKLPDRRWRLYRTGVAAADAHYAAEASGVADTAINLVFLTETNDTRFDDYCVLRPLDTAYFG